MALPQRQPAVAPPRLLSRPAVWFAAAAALLVPFFVTIPPGLRKHPLIGPLGDQLHVPLLAALTLLTYWKGPLRGRLWLSALAAAAAGAAIEPLQILVGRAAYWGDWALDLVGIGMVVAYVGWRGHGRRLGLAALLILATVVPYDLRDLPAVMRAGARSGALFPVLDDFQSPDLHRLWKGINQETLAFAEIPDGPRGSTRVLQLAGVPSRPWPGAQMVNFPYDWRGWSRLTLSARCLGPQGRRVPFAVSLDDFAGRRRSGRVTTRFAAGTDWETFTVPLDGRKADRGDHVMDLRDMDAILIFLPNAADSVALQIDDIRLEK